MKPRQSGRHIFLLVFYPLLTNKGELFSSLSDDLRQFWHIRLVLVAFVFNPAVLQIVQRIIILNTLDNILMLIFCF